MTWKRFDPADYAVGDPIFVASGRWSPTVMRYSVTKKTPTGQIVAEHDNAAPIRITPKGNIVGNGSWAGRFVVSAERAAEMRAANWLKARFNAIGIAADDISKAARGQDLEAITAAIIALDRAYKDAASAIEARSGETAQTGSTEGESATGNAGDAQTPSGEQP